MWEGGGARADAGGAGGGIGGHAPHASFSFVPLQSPAQSPLLGPFSTPSQSLHVSASLLSTYSASTADLST